MRSCQVFMSELREKILLAEDQLVKEKKAYLKIEKQCAEERERWKSEIREEQIKVHQAEKELKQKEEKLEIIQKEQRELKERFVELDKEIETTKKDIQQRTQSYQEEMIRYAEKKRTLENELNRIIKMRKDAIAGNNLSRMIKKKELTLDENAIEQKLRAELEDMARDYANKIEFLAGHISEKRNEVLAVKKQELKEANEALEELKEKCEEMSKANKELQSEIAFLKNPF